MGVNGSVFERLREFIKAVFKTTVEIFLEALKLSPNAQGYIGGSVSELLLKRMLEDEYRCEVERIREKWEGQKHPNHHGDFYFRKRDEEHWYVIECKGVKSNSEKWHGLYNYETLRKFLITHAEKIPWIEKEEGVEKKVEGWIAENLPKFKEEYSNKVYSYEEIQRYLQSPPTRETKKFLEIKKLEGLSRDEVSGMIEERLRYVMDKVKVLETHFVTGTSGVSNRTQATPRVDEFNVVAVDVVLRYPEHKFLFANPKLLQPSGDDPNHLQQNYVMGFVFSGANGRPILHATDEWYDNLTEVCATLRADDRVLEEDKQVDRREMVIYGESELEAGE